MTSRVRIIRYAAFLLVVGIVGVVIGGVAGLVNNFINR